MLASLPGGSTKDIWSGATGPAVASGEQLAVATSCKYDVLQHPVLPLLLLLRICVPSLPMTVRFASAGML